MRMWLAVWLPLLELQKGEGTVGNEPGRGRPCSQSFLSVAALHETTLAFVNAGDMPMHHCQVVL
jgi:hypothetical protein